MATDVVPQLMQEIETAFKSNTMTDRRLASVSKRIRDGTATLSDGHLYAERIGKNASKALQKVLTEENLPDGKLYYNIANRTVKPVLAENQRLINDAAADIQKITDVKTGIGLNSVKPNFPEERIQGLIDKMTADGIGIDDALKWLAEPIVNNSEAFYDDFVRENADFRSKSGLKTKITRIAESKACEWCQDLAGTFDYGHAPDDIYRRHEFCRCVVTVTSERDRTTQNVWSKKQWQSTPEELARREGTKGAVSSAAERKQVLERLETDKLVKKVMNATGYSRQTSLDIVNQGQAKIDKELKKARSRKAK